MKYYQVVKMRGGESWGCLNGLHRTIEDAKKEAERFNRQPDWARDWMRATVYEVNIK